MPVALIRVSTKAHATMDVEEANAPWYQTVFWSHLIDMSEHTSNAAVQSGKFSDELGRMVRSMCETNEKITLDAIKDIIGDAEPVISDNWYQQSGTRWRYGCKPQSERSLPTSPVREATTTGLFEISGDSVYAS
ncbi:hypothetical protein ACKRZS_004224 [Fusarium odoratissimum]